MKILGLIPARGGSKGIPLKNIKLLGGKPLISYTYESAKKSSLLSKVVLSSDDQAIIGVAHQIGLEVPFKRPPSIAKDNSTSVEVIKHAIEALKMKGEEYDAICLLQPTTPFREEDLIDRAIRKFESEDYDSLISVREVPHQFNPHWVFVEEEEKRGLKIATGEKKIISRRQELPKAYHRDGAIYLIKVEIILNQDSIIGERLGYINCEDSIYINLDEQEDWSAAENYLKDLEMKKNSKK